MATREEAFRAGFENPLIGGIEPLQRIYGTVRAMGEEFGGADMGTPFGQRFRESQKQSKAEAKRLKALREQFPEEFGRGQAQAGDIADPYMFGLGLPPMAMRPGVAQGQRMVVGPGGRPMLAGPGMMEGELVPPRAGYLGYEAPVRPAAGPAALPPPVRALPPAEPPAPYYRNVPSDMGTSFRPMTPFQQNQVGMATGRYGTAGYAPEMAVTDFESYGPMGARPAPGPYAPSGFDRNMLEAFRAGRANYGRNVRPEPLGGGYTLEELGQAVAPYRQGGLTYEPVGMAPQGGSNLPAFAASRSLRPTMIEGEFREIPGIGYGGRPYGGEMNFGVSRGGAGAPPSGFDPRVAALAGGAGYLAGAYNRGNRAATALSGEAPGGVTPLAPFNPNIPVRDFGPRGFADMYPMEAMPVAPEAAPAETAGRGEGRRGKQTLPPVNVRGKKRGTQGPEMPTEGQFEPNLNYYVTQALDRLTGQNQAELGRRYQEQLARQGYYY